MSEVKQEQDDSYWRNQFMILQRQYDALVAKRKEQLKDAYGSGSQRCNFFEEWYSENYPSGEQPEK